MDKLTHPITAKFSEDDVPVLLGMAEARGMGLSEYIRHLVLQDRDLLHRKWQVLDGIFGSRKETVKVHRGSLSQTGDLDD